jgi:MYXO-CTERM domain-containing protein
MKKLLSSLVVAASLSAGVASAATYSLLNVGNYSPLHNQGLSVTSWNAVLTANASGISTLTGSLVASDHKTYQINMALIDTYFVGATQYWGNFSGAITGNGRAIALFDITPARQTSTDACLGINCTPYNNGTPGGNTQNLEFGFWGDNSPLAGGTRTSDVNTQARCTSGTGATGPANPNGTCTTGNPNPNPVPVPGSLALLGLGLLALGARRTKRA